MQAIDITAWVGKYLMVVEWERLTVCELLLYFHISHLLTTAACRIGPVTLWVTARTLYWRTNEDCLAGWLLDSIFLLVFSIHSLVKKNNEKKYCLTFSIFTEYMLRISCILHIWWGEKIFCFWRRNCRGRRQADYSFELWLTLGLCEHFSLHSTSVVQYVNL